LLLLAIIFCCFGAARLAVSGDDFDSVGDDTADVNGVGAGNEGGFTVFGIPHMRASVVLTTLRLGLLGSHIFALSSGDIVVVLDELAVDSGVAADDCCAYTWILLQIPKINTPTITEKTA
jgi:hypothetical protein